MTVTHHTTLSAELRKICNSSDLGGLNTQWFLAATFINDLAIFVQEKEQEAYNRGLAVGRQPTSLFTP